MRTASKKLALAKQTLRTLTADQLGGAHGGELVAVQNKGLFDRLSGIAGYATCLLTTNSYDDPTAGPKQTADGAR